jgi:hypothetical protein
VTVTEGEEAKFVIKVSGGKPKPKVKWFYEEEEIVTETTEFYEVIESDDIITLIVKNVAPKNAGNYSAQLYNDAGQLNTNKAQLVVNSKFYFKIKYF